MALFLRLGNLQMLHQSTSRKVVNQTQGIIDRFLPILARAFERTVASQLSNFCDRRSVVPQEQHGFRKGRSCETALIQMSDQWLSYIDRGEYVGAILIYLSKAFDSVSHSLLLNKLQSINFSTNSLLWFHSYLSNRQQRVVTRESITSFKSINRGVPQGSCLSPLLFNIYVNDLPLGLSCDTTQDADDITESAHDTSLNTVKTKLIDSFAQTVDYCNKLELTVNTSKTQIIIFKNPNKKFNVNPEISINDINLTYSSKNC